MAKSKSYSLMLEFQEGGTITPIPWSKEHLLPDNIVFVINEDSQAVYTWVGKKNNLVKRRTALRQGDSLKGHGFQVGKIIVGRGVTQILEIDERKVGNDPEVTRNHEKFMVLFDQPFEAAMEEVIVLGEGGNSNEQEEILAPTRRVETPMKPAPSLTSKAAAIQKLTVKEKVVPPEEEESLGDENLSGDEEIPEIQERRINTYTRPSVPRNS